MISIPPPPLPLIWVVPDHSQWLVSTQCSPTPILLLMIPSDIIKLLVWSAISPKDPPLFVIRLSPPISAVALSTLTPTPVLLLITFSVPGVPSPPFSLRRARLALSPFRPLPETVTVEES